MPWETLTYTLIELTQPTRVQDMANSTVLHITFSELYKIPKIFLSNNIINPVEFRQIVGM